ncbi:MAG: hypothetical protein PHS47_04905 [Methanocellales archaeon]|nr:hypothetical protein [Methanocellales archaeon]MDD3421620.1 hypothetical protein [Methanocellales archaeon]MDD5447414.1 hypothetical protein [Methanocellales archaeon]
MRIKIKVTIVAGEERYTEVQDGGDYESLLINLGINPETVIVYRDQQVMPLDECVEPGDIKILKVVPWG